MHYNSMGSSTGQPNHGGHGSHSGHDSGSAMSAAAAAAAAAGANAAATGANGPVKGESADPGQYASYFGQLAASGAMDNVMCRPVH